MFIKSPWASVMLMLQPERSRAGGQDEQGASTTRHAYLHWATSQLHTWLLDTAHGCASAPHLATLTMPATHLATRCCSRGCGCGSRCQAQHRTPAHWCRSQYALSSRKLFRCIKSACTGKVTCACPPTEYGGCAQSCLHRPCAALQQRMQQAAQEACRHAHCSRSDLWNGVSAPLRTAQFKPKRR